MATKNVKKTKHAVVKPRRIGKYGALPPAFKRKWVKALRSGKYAQGYGRLREELEPEMQTPDGFTLQEPKYGYCCLGVACEISTGDEVDVDWNAVFIPFNVESVPPMLRGGDNDENALVEKLAKMNDEKRRSFKQIAAWIERNL